MLEGMEEEGVVGDVSLRSSSKLISVLVFLGLEVDVLLVGLFVVVGVPLGVVVGDDDAGVVGCDLLGVSVGYNINQGCRDILTYLFCLFCFSTTI